jgi:hypothetical protein
MAVALFGQLGYAQTTAQDILTEAQQAYLRGDTETAKHKFQIVLEMNPHNLTAQNYLHMIEIQQKSTKGTGAETEKKLSTLVLAHLEVKDATFQTTLDYLKQLAEKQGQAVSFVVQVPPEVADAKKVTLNLSNIPFTEVLRYMGELTGFKFSVEKYAIVVKLPQAETTTAAVSPPPAP